MSTHERGGSPHSSPHSSRNSSCYSHRSVISELKHRFHHSADEQEKRRLQIARGKSLLSLRMDAPLRSLMEYKITVLPLIFRRVEVWAFTMLHIALFAMKECNCVFEADDDGSEAGIVDTSSTDAVSAGMDTGDFRRLATASSGSSATLSVTRFTLTFQSMSITSSLMSLLLVFFNSDCYRRFNEFYGAATGMSGTLQEVAQMTSVLLKKTPNVRWDVLRYLTSSAIIVYMKVTDLGKGKPMKLDESEWERLVLSEEDWLGTERKKKKPSMPPLLYEHEMETLKRKECVGKEHLILQTWALHYLHDHLSEMNFKDLQEAVLRLRRSCAYIINTLAQPMPFPYYHALLLLMYLNYWMYAFTFLTLDSYLTPIAMFLVIAITTGVRELGACLANPFGEDDVDFNTSKMVHTLRGLISFMAESDDVNTLPRNLADLKRDALDAQATPSPRPPTSPAAGGQAGKVGRAAIPHHSTDPGLSDSHHSGSHHSRSGRKLKSATDVPHPAEFRIEGRDPNGSGRRHPGADPRSTFWDPEGSERFWDGAGYCAGRLLDAAADPEGSERILERSWSSEGAGGYTYMDGNCAAKMIANGGREWAGSGGGGEAAPLPPPGQQQRRGRSQDAQGLPPVDSEETAADWRCRSERQALPPLHPKETTGDRQGRRGRRIHPEDGRRRSLAGRRDVAM